MTMATSAESQAPRFYTWKAEPGSRGTFSILITCLITMTLCVWTAIHLNLPEYRKDSRQKWRKIGWLFVALLAPEMVAFTAFTQYQEAQRISTFVRKLWEQPEPPSWTSEAWSTLKKAASWMFWLTIGLPIFLCYALVHLVRGKKKDAAEEPKAEGDGKDYAGLSTKGDYNDDENENSAQRRHPWTLTHSFFAAMGGFALDTRGGPYYLHGKKRRMTLTVRGLSWLLQSGANLNPVPDITEREILDRSKANELAKTLVCLQATWFCIQCFTRWGQHLFVSLLELNTLAHCFCALLIYCLWWSKPLDIAEPSLLRGEGIDSLGAIMAMFSYGTIDLKGTAHYPLLKYVDMDAEVTAEKQHVVHKEANSNNKVDLQPNDAFAGFIFLGFQNPTTKAVVTGTLSLDSTAVRCWTRAGEAFKSNQVPYRMIWWRGPKNDVYDMKKFMGSADLKMLEDRVVNHPSTTDWVPQPENLDGMGLLRHTRSLLTLGFALAGFCYGGLHLIAWNSPFRTELERRLWKLSGIVLASSGVLIFLFAFLFDVIKYNELGRRRRWQCKAVPLGMGLREYLEAYSATFPFWESDRFYNQLRYIMYFLAGCGGVLYVFCRFYLVVESFIGLSHLPESAFLIPVWSKYFPHIT